MKVAQETQSEQLSLARSWLVRTIGQEEQRASNGGQEAQRARKQEISWSVLLLSVRVTQGHKTQV